ncbi:MAG: ATP-binding protein [Planctomycetes bacterium]|nr:ATP-binding protein [Planctomycetota bacterium]
MFEREILKDLAQWKDRKNRKPLVLRGARQTGKTTAIEMFGNSFDHFLSLNLEKIKDRELFEQNLSAPELVEAIYFAKETSAGTGSQLIFIDEIQNSPEAVAMMRYFYEEVPHIHFVAAGSLLDPILDKKNISFPVGRVEYMYIYPLTFTEFLLALGKNQSLEILQRIPCPKYALTKLQEEYQRYIQIGGMPAIVQNFIDTQDSSKLQPIFEGLIESYQDDALKYSISEKAKRCLQHAMASASIEAGQRIKFNGFGRSDYGSKDMSEALRLLEKAMIIQLLYPTTETSLPLVPEKKKSPRLMFLDTGLMNYSMGLQGQFFKTNEINDLYKGKLAEHIVGQQLNSKRNTAQKISFWVREKNNSSSEIDYVLPWNHIAIPVEVKSGKSGRLRSLHQFMDQVDHKYAVRLYSGDLSIELTKTIKGKEYYLLNLPHPLISEIESYLDWMAKQYPSS